MSRALRQARRLRLGAELGERATDELSPLSSYRGQTTPAAGLHPAAVLVPLRQGPSGLEVLFTLRPANLSTHGGQVSFPGGRVEPQDGDRWDTALRELEEEIGVPPSAVERLAVIDEYRTITHYHVTPCVGLISPSATLTPDPREVEEVFSVPLATLRDPKCVRTMRSTRAGHSERIWFYQTTPHMVWGATAAMLTNLLMVLNPAASDPVSIRE